MNHAYSVLYSTLLNAIRRYSIERFRDSRGNCSVYLQAQIPKSNKLTALEVYVLVSLLFIFAALFQYAFLLMKQRRVFMTKYQNEIEKSSKKLAGNKVVWAKKKSPVTTTTTNWDSVVDQTAFVVYLILLLLFNIVYWLYYLV
jgi:hypothetical protein